MSFILFDIIKSPPERIFQFQLVNRMLNAFGLPFGRLVEFQLNSENHLCGFETLDFTCIGYTTAALTPYVSVSLLNVLFKGSSPQEQELWYALIHLWNLWNLKNRKLNEFSVSSPIDLDLHSIRKDLKAMGIPLMEQNGIFNLLACILHLGDLDFTIAKKKNSNVKSKIVNQDKLVWIASLLGCDAHDLESILVLKVKQISNQRVCILLNPKECEQQRNLFCAFLHFLIYKRILYQLNSLYSHSDKDSLKRISLSSFPSSIDKQNLSNGSHAGIQQLLINYVNEKIRCISLNLDKLENENEFQNEPKESLSDPIETLFRSTNQGLFYLLQTQNTDYSHLHALSKKFKKVLTVDKKSKTLPHFTIQHFHGQVSYSTMDFTLSCLDSDVNADFLSTLIVKKDENNPISNLLQTMLSTHMISLKTNQLSSSMLDSVNLFTLSEENSPNRFLDSWISHFDLLCKRLRDSQIHLVQKESFHDHQIQSKWNSKSFQAFLYEYLKVRSISSVFNQDLILDLKFTIQELDLSESSYCILNNRIYLSEIAWQSLYCIDTSQCNFDMIRDTLVVEDAETTESTTDTLDSQITIVVQGEMEQEKRKSIQKPYKRVPFTKKQVTKAPKLPFQRRVWIGITWCLTFYMCLGKSKNPKAKMAFREKVALCLLITLLNFLFLFIFLALGALACPIQNVKSENELSISLETPQVAAYGYYFEISPILTSHGSFGVSKSDFQVHIK